MTDSRKVPWSGPTLLSNGRHGAVAWSHQVENPEEVGALGAALASAFASCGERARLADVQLIAIQGRSGATFVASRGDEVVVLHRWQRKEVSAARQAIATWRSEGWTPPRAESSAPESAPLTKPGGALLLRDVQCAVIRGDVSRAQEALSGFAGHESQLGEGGLRADALLSPMLRGLVEAVASVLSDDVTPGMRALVRLSSDLHGPADLRWLARIWAARGAVRRGEGSRAVFIARDACERAKALDSEAELVSACTLAEALVVERNADRALSVARAARQRAQELEERQLVMRTWMVEAELTAMKGDLSSSLQQALHARDLCPLEPGPAVFLAKLALLRGQSDELECLLTNVDSAEASWLRWLGQGVREDVLSLDRVRAAIELSQEASTNEAVQRLVEYRESEGTSSELLEIAAIRLLRLGRYESARALCERVALQPERVEAMARLAASMPQGADERAELERPPAAQASIGLKPAGEDRGSTPNESVFSGDMGEFKLPEVLEFLRIGRRSGTLVCQSSEGVGALRLRNGNIIRARATAFDAAGQGMASPEMLAIDLDVPRPSSGEELMDQAKSVVLQLIHWSGGQFCFEPDQVSSSDESGLEADAQFVLLEVMKQIDEADAPGRRVP